MRISALPVAVAVAACLLAAAGCTSRQGGGTPGRTTAGTGSPGAIAQSPSAAPGDVTVCVNPVVSCPGEMKTEPATVQVSADGSGFVAGITWSGWGTATARGSGTLNVNDCTPNCAQGTLTGYPATITLTGLTPYGTGLEAYSSMTISAPSDSYHETYDINLVP